MSDKKNKPKKFRKRGQESSSNTSGSSEDTSSISSEDESNARDLKPMKDYLGDRKELARQLFIAVKGDKLRMMLPQVLKKMELKELEEWCANELSGMSKARILSILNGNPMIQSSDSNDSDDSGPSLEIISDTEEWGDVSDVDVTREEESASKKTSGSKKDRSKSKQLRGGDKGTKENEKNKGKSLKGKVKLEGEQRSQQKSSDVVKVKKESEGNGQQQLKEKDGESLLDLLELEMRARAIRALIRKEEDIIPTNSSSSTAVQTSTSTGILNPNSIANANSKNRARDRQLSLQVVQDKLQELDSTFNKTVNKNSQEISEEEDVVLVLQPTTTIELLSSESDDESGQGKRRNQKLENERVLEKNATAVVQQPIENNKEAGNSGSNNSKGKKVENERLTSDKNKTSSSSTLTQSLAQETDETTSDKSPKKISTDLEKFRMFKRRSQLKELKDNQNVTEENTSNSQEKESSVALESGKNNAGVVSEEKNDDASTPKTTDSLGEEKRPETSGETVKPPSPLVEATRKSVTDERAEMDEDKSVDLEIIINLDDYPDDMEDMDTGEKEKNDSSINLNREEKRVDLRKEDEAKSSGESENRTSETWATRYYRTDDVKSVIKESKIQSEIRKRLRERQRLARLNNSPSLNTAQTVTPAQSSGAEKTAGEKEGSPTTGSVEEYLALKNVETTVLPSGDNEKLGKELTTESESEKSAIEIETRVEKVALSTNEEKLDVDKDVE